MAGGFADWVMVFARASGCGVGMRVRGTFQPSWSAEGTLPRRRAGGQEDREERSLLVQVHTRALPGARRGPGADRGKMTKTHFLSSGTASIVGGEARGSDLLSCLCWDRRGWAQASPGAVCVEEAEDGRGCQRALWTGTWAALEAGESRWCCEALEARGAGGYWRHPAGGGPSWKKAQTSPHCTASDQPVFLCVKRPETEAGLRECLRVL